MAKIFSCTFLGLECKTIAVEADIANGLSSFSIVGLGDTSVQESKERVRTAIKNSGAKFPPTRKTINLAPAQIRKQGSHFDLPIAVGILLASQQIQSSKLKDSLVIGELSLDGKIKSIPGALAITQHAKEQKFKRIFLPKENADEASYIEGIEIYPLDNLRELIDFANSYINIEARSPRTLKQAPKKAEHNFSKIVGMHREKRALSITAAGGHNIILNGPPGTGKTLLARTLSSLLPPMTQQEILETTKIHSIAGRLSSNTPLITQRPFREVHHTASTASIIGGGQQSKPGEITLAHNGVLFLDEIPEFPKQLLESLRQPIANKYINISRSHQILKYPSNFIFVGTMNPCPCGYLNDPKIRCICGRAQILNYQRKLSGPILDRMDIYLDVTNLTIKSIHDPNAAKEEEVLCQRIHRAQQVQAQRFARDPSLSKNSDMQLDQIRKYCTLSRAAQQTLKTATTTFKLSNRAYLKVIKLAQTIADLAASPTIKEQHLAEALQYRRA